MNDGAERPPTLNRAWSIGIICVCFVTIIVFLIVISIMGYKTSADFLLILAGIMMAVLFYLMGESAGNRLTVLGVSLAGGAVLAFVGPYLFGQRVQEQLNAAADHAVSRADRRWNTKISDKDTEIKGLKGQIDKPPSADVIVKHVRNSAYDDEIGRQILKIQQDKRGPWAELGTQLALKAKFYGRVEPGTFRYCHNGDYNFDQGLVKIQIGDDSPVGTAEIHLVPGKDVGAKICKTLDYDLQLGCDALAEFFPDAVAECTGEPIRWKAGESNRSIQIYATAINPANGQ